MALVQFRVAVETNSLAYTSPTTAGNLLIACMTERENANAPRNGPAGGWTRIGGCSTAGGSENHTLYFKVANGTETTITMLAPGPTNHRRFTIAEFDSPRNAILVDPHEEGVQSAASSHPIGPVDAAGYQMLLVGSCEARDTGGGRTTGFINDPTYSLIATGQCGTFSPSDIVAYRYPPAPGSYLFTPTTDQGAYGGVPWGGVLGAFASGDPPPPAVGGDKGRWFWRVVQPGDGPTVTGVRDAAGLVGLARLLEVSGVDSVLNGPSASADTTSPFSIVGTPGAEGRIFGGLVYAHDDSEEGDALAPLAMNVEDWEGAYPDGPVGSVVYLDTGAAGSVTIGESARTAVPAGAGAGIQTLYLEGNVAPTLIVQTRILYADRDALLQLTPAKTKRGAGASEVLPVGVYNDYHYRAAVRFPAIDWTGVKRVRSARLIMRRSTQELVQFGAHPTIYVRRITRDWVPGTSVTPSRNNAFVWGNPTSQTNQVKANLAGPGYENKYRNMGVSAIVSSWAPVSAGGKGLPDYGFMLVPYTGREVDTTEFWSLERGGASRPRLELQLEVLA